MLSIMATLNTGPLPLPAGSNYLDNIVFKKRNPIILRSLCLVSQLLFKVLNFIPNLIVLILIFLQLFGIIVYGCMVVDAWAWSYNTNSGDARTKRCLYGEGSEGVCTFGIFVSFIGLLAAIIFLGGEFVIDKVSLVHYRLQYYYVETVFSGT